MKTRSQAKVDKELGIKQHRIQKLRQTTEKNPKNRDNYKRIPVTQFPKIELKHHTIKMTEHLKQVEKLCLDGNIAEHWKRFKRNFDIYMVASGINTKPNLIKVNTFLNAIGSDAVEVFDTFTLTEEQKGEYNEVIKAFTEFCTPKKNQIYERFMFYQRKQKENEPFDAFLMDIKRLVKTCEFGDKENEMLRDQIVMGIDDKKQQQRLLEKADLNYDTAVEKCRANEATKEQSSTMNKSHDIHEVRSGHFNSRYSHEQPKKYSNNNGRKVDKRDMRLNGARTQSQQQHRNSNTKSHRQNGDSISMIENCSKCALTHKRRECPAYGKICNSCKRGNHFARCCKSKKVDSFVVNDNSNYDFDDNEEFYIGTVEQVSKITESNVYPWLEKINIKGKLISFKVDTGAEIDVLPLSIFKRLIGNVNLIKTGIILKAFGGQKINPMGMCLIDCKYHNKTLKRRIAVVDIEMTPILGLKSCIEFGIVSKSKEKHL
ncbi:uncharacterized protein LOC116351469 [Contarinia nasturtii]|uniref:uncharacterized protein LOC116351469 n=1 Tax=Contarinia nasturtii TaxID=265458 RepID=UPI0012D40D19|nr:uncharacterized protein LOC116351469 [Contarinia nasturtii]